MLSGSLFSSRAFGSNLSSCSLLRVAVMEDDLVSQAASSVGPVVLATLAVCFTLSKACVCCLCNAKSTDPSPLVGGEEDDQYGGRRPWNKYRKVRHPGSDEQVKVPEGKLCMICFSTFRALGLNYKYPSYGAYYKEIVNDNSKHTSFINSMKEWIKQRNEDPTGRMDREAVKKAHTTLHSETKTGVKLKGPKREFVLLEHWDPKLDGELDEAHIVEETWQGKKVKGIWRAKGRAGVLEASGYEDTSLAERTEEHSGSGPFAEQALVTKKTALQKVFADADEERQKHTVAAGPASQAGDVLATLQKMLPNLKLAGGGQALSADPEADEASPSALVDLHKDEDEDEAEEEEEVCPAARLAATVGGPKAAKAKPKANPKATAKAASRPSVTATPKAAEGRRPGEQSNSSARPKAAAAKATEEPQKRVAATETLQLDGRGKRLKENLAEMCQKLEDTLEANHLEVNYSLQHADAKLVYSKKTKALNSLLNTATKQIKKIEDSVNKHGLVEELERFQSLQDVIQKLLDVFTRLNIASPVADELAEAVEACKSSPFNIVLGPEVWQKLLSTKCSQCCLYQDFSAYCKLFRSSEDEARRLHIWAKLATK